MIISQENPPSYNDMEVKIIYPSSTSGLRYVSSHDSDISKFENVFYDHQVKNIFEVSKIRRKDICGNSHAEI
jgi:hypothetical protein